MRLYQVDHEGAFHLLYKRYSSRVYGFLRKKLKNPQTVNEAFQASFLKLHRSRDKYNPNFLFAPWLFSIVQTSAIDIHRKNSKAEQWEQIENIAEIVSTPPTETDFAKDLVQTATISEVQRRAVQMRYLEELSFEEISRQLGTSEGNVRQLVSRAIKQLRLLLNSESK